MRLIKVLSYFTSYTAGLGLARTRTWTRWSAAGLGLGTRTRYRRLTESTALLITMYHSEIRLIGMALLHQINPYFPDFPINRIVL